MQEQIKRQPNFEILRNLLMFLIVVWHFYGKGMKDGGHTLDLSFVGIFNYVISQYIIVLCSVAVDVFVLITGYFMVFKGFKSKRWIKVWVETFFYSFGLTFFFHLVDPGSVSIGEVLKSLLPMRFSPYWFVTQYLGLLLVAPFLGKAARSMSKRTYQILLLAYLIVGTDLVGGYPFGDVLGFGIGYSLVWFSGLFFIGGYIRIYGKELRQVRYLRIYLLGAFAIFAWFVLVMIVKSLMSGENRVTWFDLHYNSFPILIAVPLFLWFKNHPFKDTAINRFLVRIAPYSFAVYLIHSNAAVNNFLFGKVFNFSNSYLDVLLLPKMIISCVIIYIVCILIEACRDRVFKLCGVYKMEDFVSNKVDGFIKNALKQLPC